MRTTATLDASRPVLALAAWVLLGASAGADPSKPEPWRLKGLALERRGAWLEACRCYEDALRRERNHPAAREGLQRSLRRLHLANRHADDSYRQGLDRLTPVQAMDAYAQVLSILRAAYPDRERTGWQSLFRQGLAELRLALDEPLFRRHHLAGVRPAAVAAFKRRLGAWRGRVGSLSEAREQALLVVRSAARDGIALRPGRLCAFLLELAAGACNTLDEFSSFLTPGTMSAVKAALGGKLLGVGVELGVVNDRLTVTRVYPKSPADGAGLVAGDRLLKVGGVPVEDLPADAAAERLRGEANSAVEVEVEGRKPVRLVRRAFPIASVEYVPPSPMAGDPVPIGYLRIRHFQDSTYQEVKEALLAMGAGEPVRGLVLDLRGNPGGVFKSAVAVAELFLGDGVIVVGQSPVKDFNRTFKADNPAAAAVPIVVLVDGETASSAEVLAGALKESRAPRAPTLLLGQATFGKGSVQLIIPMEKAPLDGLAGIRLTVARLLSPSSQPVTGRGVTPDQPTALEGDALLRDAREKLLQLIEAALAPRVVMGGES